MSISERVLGLEVKIFTKKGYHFEGKVTSTDDLFITVNNKDVISIESIERIQIPARLK